MKYSHVSPVNIFDIQKQQLGEKPTLEFGFGPTHRTGLPLSQSHFLVLVLVAGPTHTDTHTDQCNTWRPHHNDTHASPHTYISRRAC